MKRKVKIYRPSVPITQKHTHTHCRSAIRRFILYFFNRLVDRSFTRTHTWEELCSATAARRCRTSGISTGAFDTSLHQASFRACAKTAKQREADGARRRCSRCSCESLFLCVCVCVNGLQKKEMMQQGLKYFCQTFASLHKTHDFSLITINYNIIGETSEQLFEISPFWSCLHSIQTEW